MKKRFADKNTLGRSTIVPYKPGEDAMERHSRRLQTNLDLFEFEAREWAAERNVMLTITNSGHHWKFTKNTRSVQWWPSSAKCVVNNRWRKGIHVHDWTQLKQVLNVELPEKSRVNQ